MHVEPVTESFAAVCTDIDLGKPMGEDQVQEIIRTIDKYGVLVFPGQFLTVDQLVDFGTKFGGLDTTLQQKLMNNFQNRLKNDAVSDISNVAVDGEVVAPTHKQAMMNVSNRFWHSDRSFAHFPDRYQVLSCVVPVSRGGQTQYADLRASYDDLDDDTKDLIADKVAVFFSHNMRDYIGAGDSDAERRSYPPVMWPMVRTHPGSGRKLLWCDTKVCKIMGMSLPEGRALVHELIEHIGKPSHVYSHTWSAGDVVMTDQRCVLHRGLRFDLNERREMVRVEIVDDVHSLGEMTLDEAMAEDVIPQDVSAPA